MPFSLCSTQEEIQIYTCCFVLAGAAVAAAAAAWAYLMNYILHWQRLRLSNMSKFLATLVARRQRRTVKLIKTVLSTHNV